MTKPCEGIKRVITLYHQVPPTEVIAWGTRTPLLWVDLSQNELTVFSTEVELHVAAALLEPHSEQVCAAMRTHACPNNDIWKYASPHQTMCEA